MGASESREGVFDKKTTSDEAAAGHDLTGKIAIVTGASSGIGKATARVLAKMNCQTVLAVRDEAKGEATKKELMAALSADPDALVKAEHMERHLVVMKLDLASLKSVQAFAKAFTRDFQRLDYLINNAGVWGVPAFTLTEDGHELQFQVNHLGHFYLTLLLTDVLGNSKPSRVVQLSSGSYAQAPKNFDQYVAALTQQEKGPGEQGYGRNLNYAIAKACNLLFAYGYHQRFHEMGISATSAHPGAMIATGIARHLKGGSTAMKLLTPFTKSVDQGASTTLRCALMPLGELKGGAYYADCQPLANLRADFTGDRLQKAADDLWKLSVALLDQGRFPWKVGDGAVHRSMHFDETTPEERAAAAAVLFTPQSGSVLRRPEDEEEEEQKEPAAGQDAVATPVEKEVAAAVVEDLPDEAAAAPQEATGGDADGAPDQAPVEKTEAEPEPEPEAEQPAEDAPAADADAGASAEAEAAA